MFILIYYENNFIGFLNFTCENNLSILLLLNVIMKMLLETNLTYSG